jgi:DNA polymerase III sliding clamp (beta) subunit (PCNA family)
MFEIICDPRKIAHKLRKVNSACDNTNKYIVLTSNKSSNSLVVNAANGTIEIATEPETVEVKCEGTIGLELAHFLKIISAIKSKEVKITYDPKVNSQVHLKAGRSKFAIDMKDPKEIPVKIAHLPSDDLAEFSMDGGELASMLSDAQKVAPTNNPNHCLNGVQLLVDEETKHLYVTALESRQCLSTKLELADFKGNGSAVIPSRHAVGHLIQNLRTGVPVRVKLTHTKVEFYYGGECMITKVLDSSKFPDFRVVLNSQVFRDSITFNTIDFNDALAQLDAFTQLTTQKAELLVEGDVLKVIIKEGGKEAVVEVELSEVKGPIHTAFLLPLLKTLAQNCVKTGNQKTTLFFSQSLGVLCHRHGTKIHTVAPCKL